MTDHITWHHGAIDRGERVTITGGEGMTVWLTGLSGSGKSTIARALEAALISMGRAAYVLDGDNLRFGLNSDLGFSAADRNENVRRVGEVAQLMADAGMVVIVPIISPYTAGRDKARAVHEHHDLRFIEVFVDTPLEVCEQRDPKGLYGKARNGEISNMTGLDDPYEAPVRPDLRIETVEVDVEAAVKSILAAVEVDQRRPSGPDRH